MSQTKIRNEEQEKIDKGLTKKFNLGQFLIPEEQKKIISLPLEFQYIPVQIISKQFTKLNNQHDYRIHYLGPRVKNTIGLHKKYAFSDKHPHIYDSSLIENKTVKKKTKIDLESISKIFDQNKKNIHKIKSYRSKEKDSKQNNENVSQNQVQRYKVNMKKIVHSFLLDEKLKNTQFFKSTAFYRAFEGMNPTLDLQGEYVFNSCFEGGNLDCVIKIQPQQFDLFLRIDSNTRGHLMWFYFSIKNGKRLQKIKLNICNISKSKSLYKNGLKPYIFSKKKKSQDFSECRWSQSGNNLGMQKKQLRYQILRNKINNMNMNCLTLQYQFTQENDEVFFAYCVPYTYSQLVHDVQTLPQKYVKKHSLGKSLLGVDILALHISNHQNSKYTQTLSVTKQKTIDLPYQSTTTHIQSQTQAKDQKYQVQKSQKKIVFVTGRIHPSESNSSYTLKGFMDWICSQNSQAKQIRDKIDFVIIPMVNPDGVILGNSRTSASGKDLNRQYINPDVSLYPQIFKIKELAKKINSSRQIALYLDFHGHSRKKNTFFYGPAYGISEPNYYKSRILPKLIQKFNNSFRYHSCSFSIIEDKKKTGRASMFDQLKIPFTYTVESSIGYFYDCSKLKIFEFNSKYWIQIGTAIAEGTTSFLLGLQYYDQMIKQRRKNRLKMKRMERFSPTKHQPMYLQDEMYLNIQLQLDEPLKIQYHQKQEKLYKKSKNIGKQFLKLLEQLKIPPIQNNKEIKTSLIPDVKDLDLQMSSDSHDQKQDMDGNKIKQLNQLIKAQKAFQNKNQHQQNSKTFQNYKKAHKNMKLQIDLQKQILRQFQQKQSRIKIKSGQGKRYNEQKIFQLNILSQSSLKQQKKIEQLHSSNVLISNNCFQTPFHTNFKRESYTSKKSRKIGNIETQKTEKTFGGNYFGEYHFFIQENANQQKSIKKLQKHDLIRRLQSRKQKIKDRSGSSNQIKMFKTSTVHFTNNKPKQEKKQLINAPTQFNFLIPSLKSESAQQKHLILKPKLRLNLKNKPNISSKSAKSSITYHSQIRNSDKQLIPQSLYLIKRPTNFNVKQKYTNFSTLVSTRNRKSQIEKSQSGTHRFAKINLNDVDSENK